MNSFFSYVLNQACQTGDRIDLFRFLGTYKFTLNKKKLKKMIRYNSEQKFRIKKGLTLYKRPTQGKITIKFIIV